MQLIGLKAVLEMSGFQSGMRAYLTGTKQMENETEKLLHAIQPVGVALAGLGAAGTVFVRSAALTAARTEELSLVLGVMAKNAQEAALAEGDLARASELSAESVEESVKAIKAKGIETQVATTLATQFIRYELDMAQATDLARVAQDAAVYGMQDSSVALDGLLHGILTYNPLVLRTYGLNVQAAQAFKDFADANGIAVEQMDSTQRAQAMLNAVLEEGTKIEGTYEAAMESSSKLLRSVTGREWKEFLQTMGEHYLPAMDAAVKSAKSLLEAFNNLDPEQQKMIANMLGIGTVVATVGGSFILLTPRIISTMKAVGTLAGATIKGAGALAAFGKDTYAAFTLMSEGASAAEVSTLGLAGTAAVAIPVLFALAAAAMAAYKAYQLHQEIQERQAETSDTWTKMLGEQAAAGKSATEIAKEYTEAQKRVSEAHEEGGLIADIFVNKQRVLNADMQTLNQTLAQTASSYDEYRQAVASINAELLEGETAVAMLSQAQWEEAQAAERAALQNREFYGYLEGVQVEALEASEKLALMTQALSDLGIEGPKATDVERALAIQLGETTQLAVLQEDAMKVLALAYEQGTLGQEEYIEAGLKVLSIQQDSAMGYQGVRKAVADATDSFFGLDDALRDVPSAMQQAARAAIELADIEKRMAEDQADIAKRVLDMEKDYNQQLVDMAIDRARAIEDIDRNLAQQRAAAAAQLAQRLTQIETQGTQQTEQAAYQHAQRMAQIEEQYQERLRQIQETYAKSRSDAIRSRDALALIEAERTRDKETDEAKHERDKQHADASADYAQQQAEQAANLEAQRQAAIEAYQQQMADLELSRQEQIDELDRSEKRQLEDLERHNQWTIEEMRDEFRSEYIEAVNAYANQESLYANHLQNMRAIWESYGGSWGQQPTGQRGVIGGYQEGGAFVTRGPTTATFGEGGVPELVIAQPLQSVASQGGGGSMTVSGTMRHEVSGAVSGLMAGYEGRLSAMISQAVVQAFTEVLRR